MWQEPRPSGIFRTLPAIPHFSDKKIISRANGKTLRRTILITFEAAHWKTLLSIGALKLVRHSGWNVKSPDSRSGLGDNFSGGALLPRSE